MITFTLLQQLLHKLLKCMLIRTAHAQPYHGLILVTAKYLVAFTKRKAQGNLYTYTSMMHNIQYCICIYLYSALLMSSTFASIRYSLFLYDFKKPSTHDKFGHITHVSLSDHVDRQQAKTTNLLHSDLKVLYQQKC